MVKYAVITFVLLQAFTSLVFANHGCQDSWIANKSTGRAICKGGDGRHQCYYTHCSFGGKQLKADLGAVSFVHCKPANANYQPEPDPNYQDGRTVHSITYFLVEGDNMVVDALDEFNNFGNYLCPVSKNPTRPTCDPAHCEF